MKSAAGIASCLILAARIRPGVSDYIVLQAIYDAGWPVWIALLFLFCFVINGLKG